MRKLKIKFINFDPTIPREIHPLVRCISANFKIEESNSPDYVIVCGDGDHHKYNSCVKILLQCENMVCDFNSYDYAIGFDHMSFGDRYIRVPWFVFYPHFHDLAKMTRITDEQLLQRKFCSFVVSNSRFADPLRQLFFERLSKYKKVDSGGRFMNNVGGTIRDKIAFCREYKFNIAFENSASLGYTTEKIMDAYAAHSIPIYYGNPNVDIDFSPQSMVWVKDASDVERAVEEVIYLDNNDDAYLKKALTQCLINTDICHYERKLELFLLSIFEQPITAARRRNLYGYQAMMESHMRIVMGVDYAIRRNPLYAPAIKTRDMIKSVIRMFR